MVRCAQSKVLSKSRRAAKKTWIDLPKSGKKEKEMSVLGVVSIVSIITAVFAGLLIGIEIAEAFPKRKFERLFGFRPGCLSSKTIEQMAVEERLKDLAMRFSKACQIENEFRSKVVSDFSGKDGVRAAKKRFWQAHEFAKRMGYDVRVRHSDYL